MSMIQRNNYFYTGVQLRRKKRIKTVVNEVSVSQRKSDQAIKNSGMDCLPANSSSDDNRSSDNDNDSNKNVPLSRSRFAAVEYYVQCRALVFP